MPEERADALIQFGADDVFEAAGLRVRFGVVDSERIFEEPLGQPMPAHDASGALAAYGRKLRFAISQFH